MKKIVIAPDSFKGTFSATEVCLIISRELTCRYPDLTAVQIPVADGGEGTVEALITALGGEKIFCTVKSPLGRDVKAYYGILPDGTAVIEMAQASGITIEKENNALKSSTYGTGQLILEALDNGAENIVIGIGGSATTDGGIGALSALGIRFLDKNGMTVPTCGEGLHLIDSIDLSALDKRLADCNITLLCDVTNPLYGKNGAAYIFAPQKGASKSDVMLLDNGLRNLARVSEKALGKDFSQSAGSGAAGGLGFGLIAFLGAKPESGIDYILKKTDFVKETENADLVITGEGKMDSQSLMGKVPFRVAEKAHCKKIIALVGVNDIEPETALKGGISQIIEANPMHLPFDKIKSDAKKLLIDACKNIIL
ncbi:MAG: glycerate kinase [Clostridia bacterium]|nr:glycerate kinase [Clostridia bacterium]